jgi:catechol 2,3-dioxygenase-like lactoylglutathione lyase family enzyme
MYSHVTFGSNDLKRSRVFYDAVMSVLGHRLLFELPRGFCYGDYHPNYYGAYVRDPDGNKLQAVCHRKDG